VQVPACPQPGATACQALHVGYPALAPACPQPGATACQALHAGYPALAPACRHPVSSGPCALWAKRGNLGVDFPWCENRLSENGGGCLVAHKSCPPSIPNLNKVYPIPPSSSTQAEHSSTGSWSIRAPYSVLQQVTLGRSHLYHWNQRENLPRGPLSTL